MIITGLNHPIPSPRILFLALANDIGLERLPSAMVQFGAVCAIVSPPGFYAAETRYLERRFALPRHRGMWLGLLSTRDVLETAVKSWLPNLLVPLDDVAALLLRKLARVPSTSHALRDLIETSCGDPSGYSAAGSRAELMQLASALPVRLPHFHVADSEASTLRAAAAMGYPVVLKAEHTCGGRGVVVATNETELKAALTASTGAVALWRRARAAGRRWLWNRAGIDEKSSEPPILQKKISGVPAMRTVAAWNGQILEGVSFVAERVHPHPNGASSVVRHIEHAEMAAAVGHLVRALGCSGFVSFDFMLDAEDNAAFLIEMNPRPIGTTHLGRVFGHDVVGAMVAKLQGHPAPPPALTPLLAKPVALFPKELERDPAMLERLASSAILHDVPQDDPAVVAAYLRRLSRIHPRAADKIARFVGQGNPPSPSAPITAEWRTAPNHTGISLT